MNDAPETYTSYHEGYVAFMIGDTKNPYLEEDENRGFWADGWLAAFNNSLKAGK